MRSDRDLESLVKKCREGDADAWGCLVDRFQALVYSIPIKHGLNSDDAADVFQHTFQILHSHLDRIQVIQTLPKWLATTAARESLKILRIKRRTVDTEDSTLDEIVASEEKGAEASAVETWQSQTLREEVARMGGRCKELLTLLYFEERSYDEITEKIGMPMGAIGPTRARCLEKLRKTLQAMEFFE